MHRQPVANVVDEPSEEERADEAAEGGDGLGEDDQDEPATVPAQVGHGMDPCLSSIGDGKRGGH